MRIKSKAYASPEQGNLSTYNQPPRIYILIANNIFSSCFLSTGLDKHINLYSTSACLSASSSSQIVPSNIFLSQTPLNNISHSHQEGIFATSGQLVQIWSYERSKPTSQLTWGADSMVSVKFNPSEQNILCSTGFYILATIFKFLGMDRSIVLFDIRGNTPINRTFLSNKSNAICWNP